MATRSTSERARKTRITKALKAAFRPELATGGDDTVKIRVCAGSTCNATGRAAVSDALTKELAKRGLSDKVEVVLTGCHGLCQEGPIAVVHPKGVFYPRLKAKDMAEIVETSVVGDDVVERLLYRDPATGEAITLEKDVPFYAGQTRVVRAVNGTIDPTSDRRLPLARRLRGARRGARGRRPRGRHRRGRALGPARPRRRRVPHRHQVALLPRQPGREALHHRQRRRGRPRRVHGPGDPRGQPALARRGHAHRRLRHRRRRGLRLRPPRVPAGRLAPAARPGAGARARPARRRHPGHRLVVRPEDQPGRRRVRLRRVDGAHGLHRGAPRHAARQAHPHGRPRPLAAADRPQQRRDLRQRAVDRQPRRRRVRRHGHRRRPRAPRSSRSPASRGTPASSRCPWAPPCARSSSTSAAACRTAASSRPCSSAAPAAAACRPTCSTRRSTSRTSRSTAP